MLENKTIKNAILKSNGHSIKNIINIIKKILIIYLITLFIMVVYFFKNNGLSGLNTQSLYHNIGSILLPIGIYIIISTIIYLPFYFSLISSIELNNDELSIKLRRKQTFLPKLTPQQIDRVVITKYQKNVLLQLKKSKTSKDDYLVTIELHPKTAQERNNNGYSLLSRDFDDLSALFIWCKQHNVKIEQGYSVD
ncbi:hypothetical protein [Psychrobacter sp. I-STPA6b]|uniref:hypothetical protein n=1 Tax=Psychrobacter sp. I-STPA6b TaxID=2585718 RepID=UPI001D0CB19A|nr:hypothetical protein [Psychrobacter sp. I-STPA6b]